MSAVDVARFYLYLNILLVISLASLYLIELATRYRLFALTFRVRLQFAYLLLTLTVLLPFVFQTLPMPVSGEIMPVTAQVWASTSMKNQLLDNLMVQENLVSIGSATSQMMVPDWPKILLLLLIFGLAISLIRKISQFVRLQRLLMQTFRLKRIGKINVLVTENIPVPFSCRSFRKLYVVIPASLLQDAKKLRIAVAHELQHHRQLDTAWLHLINLLQTVCFWNPAVYTLGRKISELQEFACDEALIGHQRFSPLVYGQSLLWAAELSAQSGFHPAGTTGMADRNALHTLTRRVKVMMSESNGYRRNTKSAIAMFAMVISITGTVMTGAGFAANSGIKDRRITMEQADQMAAALVKDSEFPIVVNDLVLEQLNRYVGTPDGREFMRTALQRMETHRDTITVALEKYKLPSELLAVPVIESGYRNLPQSPNQRHGAGIWMFIKATGRNFGLKIDDTTDERLNVVLETDAAMRLFAALNLQFKDWGLALLGYNAGAGAVQKGIRATNSRDVWTLIRNGHENDPKYVAKVMAAMLVLKNQHLLD